MNDKKRICLMVCLVALLACLFFPPFEYVLEHGRVQNAGFAFILTPPETEYEVSSINAVVWLIEMVFIVLSFALVWLLLDTPWNFKSKAKATPKKRVALEKVQLKDESDQIAAPAATRWSKSHLRDTVLRIWILGALIGTGILHDFLLLFEPGANVSERVLRFFGFLFSYLVIYLIPFCVAFIFGKVGTFQTEHETAKFYGGISGPVSIFLFFLFLVVMGVTS
ncbi:MAG: hypothetical protein R3194_05490 [Limnobacter sp.]|nr:hypothetical protein [Limnobacter sp.]